MVNLHDQVKVPAFIGLGGVAQRDITPEAGILARNWGPAEWNISEGTHRRLTLTAIALAEESSPQSPLVLITIDGTWWRRVDDERRLRSTVLEALDLPEERLLISLSHTHAGPVLSSADEDVPGGARSREYLVQLAQAAADAAREATAGLEPAILEWTTARCSLASNRELLLDGCYVSAGAPTPPVDTAPRSLIGFNPDTEQITGQAGAGADDLVVIGRLSSWNEGNVHALGTIVNYACHPTTLAWQNSLISPDFVGAMRDLVQEETHSPVAFFQGASGELAPRQQYTGDLTVADAHGRSLGHAVLGALAGLPPPGTALELTDIVESGAPLAIWEPRPVCSDNASERRSLSVRQEAVELKLQSLATLTELEEQWADIDPRSREERMRRARNLREGYVEGTTVAHPTWCWRLGEALVVAHPGEAYSRLQRTVRAHTPRHPVLVANLTNGPGFVYLPTQEAYEVGAYQTWQSPLASGSLERLEAHACQLIDRVVTQTSDTTGTTPEET